MTASSWGGTVLYVAAYAAAALIVLWARRKEGALPRCDICGPMYFGEHEAECPKRGRPPDSNFA